MSINETKLRQANNEVSGSGYLKDFDLKYVNTDNGNVVIKGDITLATDVQKSYRLKVYCPKKTSDGKESKTYPYFDELIAAGENADSMQNILKRGAEEELSKDNALAMSRTVYIKVPLSPWERLDENDIVRTSNDIRVSFMGDAKGDKFEPGLKFKCEVYINALKSEKNEKEENTGRGILSGTLPLYGGEVSSFEAIVPAEYKEAVFNAYDVGKTVEIYGEFDVQITEVEDEAPPTQMAFGAAPEKSVSVKFKNELVLYGGSVAYSSQNEKSYRKEDIEEARAAKMEKLQQQKEEYNSNKDKKENTASTMSSMPATPRKGTFNFG